MNVIVLQNDSLRWDHMGFNGNSWIKTPNLDAFSKECAIFDNCYTDNLPTLPQRTSAFTGTLSFTSRTWESMRDKDERLSMILFDAGVHPALIFDSHPFFNMATGYLDGFMSVEFIRGYGVKAFTEEQRQATYDESLYYPEGREWNEEQQRDMYFRIMQTYKTEADTTLGQVITKTTKWLDDYDKNEPFMLWVDMFDPHEPWTPAEEYWRQYCPDYEGPLPVAPWPRFENFHMTPEEGECCRALYAGNVTFMDKWIGKLLDYLREKGIMDDTMIIYSSDHGEPLGEGPYGHGLFRKFRPWPYEELAHVPLLVRHPDGAGRDRRFDTFVQTCDLTATILDSFDLEPTEKMHGTSLCSVMKGEQEGARDFAVACHNLWGNSRSIRTKEWTYIFWPRETANLQGQRIEVRDPELYRRDEDLTEQNNVIAEYPEVARAMEVKLRQFEEQLLHGEKSDAHWPDRPK
ncbi:sulfatase [Candidatus Hydrogenedentota bacterium]